MFHVSITLTPKGMTQCDLTTAPEEREVANDFFTLLRPYIRALHQLATEFDYDEDREASHE